MNEVDSIRNKWNPFRALEEILNWVCACDHPKLKFIVLFRLDLYEDYDYLKEYSLPGNIMDISFAGSHEEKKWVHELQPFGEELAQALFETLQSLPQRCMAPAMTWEMIKSALGKKLNTYTHNPLLFTIFLQAHHQSKEILAIDEDDLFIMYADQMTGAALIRNRPWWRKVWGFLRNGNITPKERFLVDCVQRMAKNGSAAFLIDQLNPKDKQDKRIIAFLSKAQDEALKDLEEGRLVSQETIEVKQKNKTIATRRVTFVGGINGNGFRWGFSSIGETSFFSVWYSYYNDSFSYLGRDVF